MYTQGGPERRHDVNRRLSAIIDLGVQWQSSYGIEVVRELYLANQVPSTIAARVLFHCSKRLCTGGARLVDQAALECGVVGIRVVHGTLAPAGL